MMMRDLLARFHAAITGGAPLDTARELVEGGAIDPMTRLHVYEHAYSARIAGVLFGDYPKLARLVELCALTPDYLRAHPPAHPSLREVGVHLAGYLKARGEPAHVVDLARLERARTEVFDGPDATPLTRDDVAALESVEFPMLRLQLVPSSRVLAIATNADDIWDAIENDREPPPPLEASRTVIVWRREYTVIHRTLQDDEARVAHALAAGTTFGDACELLDVTAERAIELLVRWLDAQCLRR